MTDAEIKKALECHADTDVKACKICPYEGNKQCAYLLSEDALDLINRQQAEIERLKDENLQSEYPARIRVDDFLVCANSLGEWLEFCDSLKAEAIKEFAERVKMAFYYEFDEIIPSIMADNIDNLVKEWWVMRSDIDTKCNCCIHEEVCIKSEAYKYACRQIMHNVPNHIGDMLSGNIKCKHFQPKSATIRKCGDAE